MILDKQHFGAQDDLRRMEQMPAGPERLARMLRFITADARLFPVECEPIPPIAKALGLFEDVVELVGKVIEDHAGAAEHLVVAAQEDVRAFLAALKAGDELPDLQRAQARVRFESAGVTLEAAEELLKQAHHELIAAIHDNWAAWRREVVAAVERKREKAAKAVAALESALQDADHQYQAILRLDQGVLNRYPNEKKAAEAETREGLPWYSMCHAPKLAPLQYLSVLDGREKGSRVRVPLANVITSLSDELQIESLPAAEWLPTQDDEHEAMRERPFDTSVHWLLQAVRTEMGAWCDVCRVGKPPVDALYRTEDGKLVPVHEWCVKHGLSEGAARLIKAEQTSTRYRQRQ